MLRGQLDRDRGRGRSRGGTEGAEETGSWVGGMEKIRFEVSRGSVVGEVVIGVPRWENQTTEK